MIARTPADRKPPQFRAVEPRAERACPTWRAFAARRVSARRAGPERTGLHHQWSRNLIRTQGVGHGSVLSPVPDSRRRSGLSPAAFALRVGRPVPPRRALEPDGCRPPPLAPRQSQARFPPASPSSRHASRPARRGTAGGEKTQGPRPPGSRGSGQAAAVPRGRRQSRPRGNIVCLLRSTAVARKWSRSRHHEPGRGNIADAALEDAFMWTF